MVAEAVHSGTLRLSTGDLPARERVPFWREEFGRQLVRVEIEPEPDHPFTIDAELQQLSDLRTFMAWCSPGDISRTRPLLSDGNDDLALVMNLGPRAMLRQIGREAHLGQGDAVMISHAEACTYTHAGGNEATLILHRAALAPLVGDIDGRVARAVPAANDALRLLTGYLSVIRDGAAPDRPELARAVATHVYDLVAMALGATRDGAAAAMERGVRAARLAAVKADILANLGSRRLSVAEVGLRQRLSPRHLHRLFEGEGTTFSEFVLEARLARAHRMLTTPAHGPQTVTAIAYACGFGDLSYFNRSFRRRYGATPSEIRMAAAARH